MENSMKFTLAIDKINKKIAELNIKIVKEVENENFKNELQILLQDKQKLYKSNKEDFEKLIEKYGSTN